MGMTIDEIRAAAESGAVHTVRVSFSDRLGNWRGKRVPVRQFLASLVGPGAGPLGFCDGMLVADVVCDVIQETPYSNFETGYPDFHLFLEGCEIRPVGWVDGELFVFGRALSLHHDPVMVYPANVLGSLVSRLAADGVTATASATLSGRLMASPDRAVPVDQWPDGSAWGLLGDATAGLAATGVGVSALSAGREAGVFRVSLGAAEPAQLGTDLMVTKNALRELAQRSGLTATFMTLPRGCSEPATLSLDLEISGLGGVDARRLTALLDEARPLLQPSTNAYKVGATRAPSIEAGAGSDGRVAVRGIVASAEVEPQIALAVALAAAVESTSSTASTDGVHPQASTGWISSDARALGGIDWLERRLGRDFIENSIPLLAREGELLLAAVTDLEVDRYWAFA